MTAPAGTMAKAEDYLAASLAASAAWQTECGAANAAEALEHVYIDGLPNPAKGATHTRGELENFRPYALVFMPETGPYTARVDAISAHFEFQGSGQLILRIVRTSPHQLGDSPTHDANQTFKNLIGTIIDQLCDLAGVAGYLAFHTISVDKGPYWPDKGDIETWGLFQGVDVLVQW